MSAHKNRAIVPTTALSKTPNPVSGGNISEPPHLRTTPNHDRAFTSLTDVIGGIRHAVSTPNTVPYRTPIGHKGNPFPIFMPTPEKPEPPRKRDQDEESAGPELWGLIAPYIVDSQVDRETPPKPVSSRSSSVSGADHSALVDVTLSTGTSSVAPAIESSRTRSPPDPETTNPRISSTTECQSEAEHLDDHGRLKDAEPDGTVLDGRPSWYYEPPLLRSESVEYRCLKGQIDGEDTPILTLERVEENVTREEVIQRLREICSNCQERMRVNVVSESEAPAGDSNAAPRSMIDSGRDNPSFTLESGQFCTQTSVGGLSRTSHCLNHITHLDIFDMQFESVDIIAYLLRCMPSLRACSLRAVFIRFKCKDGIPSCFTEHDMLKLSEILVHGRDAHSMSELAKLLFRPVGSNNEASLFDKSTIEKFELCGPGWGGADAAKPYLFKVVYDRSAPVSDSIKYTPSSLTVGHCEIVSIPTYISLKRLQDLKISIRLSFSPFVNGAWKSLGSNAPNLKRIEIDISWEESHGHWSSECPWAHVLGHLDLSLWQRKSGQWPELKTLILQTHNFPPGINIVGDAFRKLRLTDPDKYDKVRPHYTVTF
ncbi:hypothetical protein EDD85DRAFT_798441 [Armillaria nabsnona]|nr:hypothetical protein EDD85DRAFT_798441 [Armillaria nabsnona]